VHASHGDAEKVGVIVGGDDDRKSWHGVDPVYAGPFFASSWKPAASRRFSASGNCSNFQ
jgi:hypothetical protein